MALKNYTTSIKIEQTISEIESILSKHGATHIFKMYDSEGIPTCLAFKVMVNGQSIAFKLPMEESKILQVFKNDSSLPKKYRNDIEQARRTGWRIIKDWVDSQMALIQIKLVKIEEVFLPYMYDTNTDETLFEKLQKRNFNMELEYKPKK